MKNALNIIYEDEDILAVNKPAGVLSHPAPGSKEETLLDLVIEKYPQAMLVHRLDKDTSGVLIIAKKPKGL